MGQLVNAPTRDKALLDLLITNNTDPIGDVEIWRILGNSDRKVITFRISHRKGKHKGNTSTQNFVKFQKRQIPYSI